MLSKICLISNWITFVNFVIVFLSFWISKLGIYLAKIYQQKMLKIYKDKLIKIGFIFSAWDEPNKTPKEILESDECKKYLELYNKYRNFNLYKTNQKLLKIIIFEAIIYFYISSVNISLNLIYLYRI